MQTTGVSISDLHFQHSTTRGRQRPKVRLLVFTSAIICKLQYLMSARSNSIFIFYIRKKKNTINELSAAYLLTSLLVAYR